MTSSTESSSFLPSNQPTTPLTPTNSNPPVEVIHDESSGLEASIRIEEDALIVEDVVLKRSPLDMAYTDLQRFNNVEDEEIVEEVEEDIVDRDWTNYEEEVEKVNEMVKDVDSISSNTDIVNDKIELPVNENDKASESPPVINSVEQDQVSPYSNDNNLSDFIETNSPTRECSKTPPLLPVEETFEKEIEETLESNLEGASSPPVGTCAKEEEEEEEYSFGDILRLASGLTPSREMTPKRDEKEMEKEIEKKKEEEEEEDETEIKPQDINEVHNLDQTTHDRTTPPTPLVINEQLGIEDTLTNTNTNPFFDEPTSPQDPITPVVSSTNPFLNEAIAAASNSSKNPFDDVTTTPNDTYLPAPFGNPFLEFTPVPKCRFAKEATPPKQEGHAHDEEPEKQSVESDWKDKSKSDDGYIMIGQSFVEPRLRQLSPEELESFEIDEEHYEQELSLGEVEYRIAQLKSHLRRDSSDQRLQQTLVKLQLLRKDMVEVSVYEGFVFFLNLLSLKSLENNQSHAIACGHSFRIVTKGVKGKRCDTCNGVTLIRQVMKCQSIKSCYFIG